MDSYPDFKSFNLIKFVTIKSDSQFDFLDLAHRRYKSNVIDFFEKKRFIFLRYKN